MYCIPCVVLFEVCIVCTSPARSLNSFAQNALLSKVAMARSEDDDDRMLVGAAVRQGEGERAGRPWRTCRRMQDGGPDH